MSETAAAPAAWHPDPTQPGMLRWWDGAAWTEHTAPDPNAPAAAAPEVAPVSAAPAVAAVAAVATPAPAMPEQALDPDTVHAADETDGSSNRTRNLLLGALVLALVGIGAMLLLRGGDEAATTGGAVDPNSNVVPVETNATPTDGAVVPAEPADPAAPGSAVPDAIDAATGNGTSTATDTAAQMQEQLDATGQVDPAADPTAAAPVG